MYYLLKLDGMSFQVFDTMEKATDVGKAMLNMYNADDYYVEVIFNDED